MITIDNIVCALVAFKKTPETVVGGIRWKIWKWYCKRKIRKFLRCKPRPYRGLGPVWWAWNKICSNRTCECYLGVVYKKE